LVAILAGFIVLVAGPAAAMAELSVTITSPTSGATTGAPSFKGALGAAGEEQAELTLQIYAGNGVGGEVKKTLAELISSPIGSEWSLGPAEGLSEGEYTAQATQTDVTSAETGKSNAVSFNVVTASPNVTISGPAALSNVRKPSFSGEASDPSEGVTVHIHNKGTGENETATAGPGSWSTNNENELSSGTYTAYATQPSSYGNEEGKSSTIEFKIVTAAPTVTITGPSALTGNTKPSFSGTASDPIEGVVVHIRNSGTGETETATAGHGSWSTSNENELASGTYTAYATQASFLHNEEGKSGTVEFTIDTAPPTVTINGPAALSNVGKPSFSGTASDPVEGVVVHIRNSGTGETETATAGHGNWSTSNENELASGTYTAYATQESSLGNTEGKSGTVEFKINTSSPTVTLTGPEALSNNTKPTFSGTASDPVEGVVVHIRNKGTGETETATAGHGNWSTSNENELASGTYTAYATQESSLGNTEGKSGTVEFKISTASPVVTITGPSALSNVTKPSFSGNATDPVEGVVVHIRNTGTGETETATAGHGSWSTNNEAELSSGTYIAYATQASFLGNTEGKSGTVEFTINTAPPEVTLEGPTTPSKSTKPLFRGTASDHTQVVVHIRNTGTNETETATAGGGSWSTSNENELASGTYTAYATQASSLGNTEGKSATVGFTINTKPPTVTLNPPAAALSNNTKPTFSGEATDPIEGVVVHIRNTGTGETETASAGPGNWSTKNEAELASGTYTAYATQKSSLLNEEGKSSTIEFTINTAPPEVTLATPPTPSKNTTPSFKGTASDHTTVIVDIYAGEHAEGDIVAEASATGNGHSWSSGAANKTLTTGEYTAVATQESSLLGNPRGVSLPVSFIVDTRSPTVTIEGPAPLSNTANPTFKGTATDTTPVVVHIFNKANAEVTSVSTTPSGGHWSTNGEGTLGSESYSAYATQRSSLENPQGESSHLPFTINTRPPTVTLNESSVARRSNNTTPSFSGEATDTEPVTVRVFENGHEVTSVTAPGTGGAWSSPALSQALAGLPAHTYSATAEQPSSLHNPTGKSNSVTFTVDTAAPTVTFTQPTTPSSVTSPAFTGTATEATPVTVRVYEEPKENEVKKITEVTATVAGGTWTTAPVGLAAGTHKYRAIAIQESEIHNNAGESAPVKFTVDTTPPKVTLTAVPKSPSNVALPTFSGTASDKEPVTVAVYEVIKAERKLVATALAKEPKTTWTQPNTSWTSAPVTPALPAGNHEYVAVATQKSSIGNLSGTSNEITFVVDTSSPAVTITSPPSPGNNLTPSFSGTATGTHASTEVSVKIFLDNAGVRGGEVSSAKATVSGNLATGATWTTGPASPALATGTNTYIAVATEESLLGNPAVPAEVTFTVNTLPPAVVLLKTPPQSSNNRIAVFEGTASDTTPVTLRIYEGKHEVASTVTPVGVGGAWRTETTLPAVKRVYNATAFEKSSITGNPEGKSTPPVTFTVDPAAPTVLLTPQPTWSNNARPSFTGSASDNSQVAIKIYAGSKPGGTAVAEATAAGTNGSWASGPVTTALPDGQYTAVASQENSITHEADVGFSAPSTFNIDTAAPQVTLTSPANGSSSGSSTWTASGAAGSDEGDLPHVTAQLFSGSSIGGGQSPVQSITVDAAGKTWSATFGGVAPGTYTLRAQQTDAAGNVGTSGTSTITVTGGSAAAHAPTAPSASFTWFPPAPRVGENISLVSSSTDAASPLTAFAWDLAGTGAFATGGAGMNVIFSTAGGHLVQLRVTDANGLTSVASQTIPVSPPVLPLLQPFPVVRITSTGTSSGVRLRQLAVQAAPGAKITVLCRGRACPLKSQSHIATASKRRAAFVEFRRFERSLKAGVILEIRISKAGRTGKYTRFAVRRGKAPVRLDACLDGVLVKPVTCPSL
jgi:hypothetical protein